MSKGAVMIIFIISKNISYRSHRVGLDLYVMYQCIIVLQKALETKVFMS
jgi:hypothetical protein